MIPPEPKSPLPEPEINKEIKSDHYSFIYKEESTSEIPPEQCFYYEQSKLPTLLSPTSSPDSVEMPKWCSVPYDYNEIDFRFPTWYCSSFSLLYHRYNRTLYVLNQRWKNYQYFASSSLSLS